MRLVIRFPLLIWDLGDAGMGVLGILSILISSTLILFFMVIILSAFSMANWILPVLVLGSSSLAPVAVQGWTYEAIISLGGFVAGSVPFPLDWPVAWKEPPIPHIFLFVIGSLIGGVIDLYTVA
jgi:hypothetical protein